jgi:hypothetical protein
VIEYVTAGDASRAGIEAVEWGPDDEFPWRRATGLMSVKGVAVEFRDVSDGFRLIPRGDVEVDGRAYYLLSDPGAEGPMIVASAAVFDELHQRLTLLMIEVIDRRYSHCDPLDDPMQAMGE